MTRYIKTENIIITDGWIGYSFISSIPGYIREMHIHGVGDFGLESSSTSQKESLWSQLKALLKNLYYIIPHKNFILYLREAEWRIKDKDKNINAKIKEFFDCYYTISDMEASDFVSDYYLNEV